MVKILFYIEDPSRAEEGEVLANRLQLEIISAPTDKVMLLVLTKTHLELRGVTSNTKPFYIDFTSAQTSYRLSKSRSTKELIARAVGIKKDYLPTVIDTTAGLGRDGLILAYLGCKVTMLERSPVLCAMLEDAMKRARQKQSAWLPNLVLHCQDAKSFLTQKSVVAEGSDVVYLDPMFPTRTKSALVKKELRIVQSLVGADDDAEELFFCAKKVAKKRVVVKRPIHAVTITDEFPAFVYKGKVCRFDVYVQT